MYKIYYAKTMYPDINIKTETKNYYENRFCIKASTLTKKKTISQNSTFMEKKN